jgi:CRISPR-associated endonuclease/helicase Cas3
MLAKSDGLSIEDHTQDLLDVFSEFKTAFEYLPKLCERDDFWDILKDAIIFHDIGKAAEGFQNAMQNGRPYGFRHEVTSAIIAQNILDNELAINAILSHHKNFETLKKKLQEYENNKKYKMDRWIEKELNELPIPWLEEFLSKFGFTYGDAKNVSLKSNINKWAIKMNRESILKIEKFQNIFLSASLSVCDHNASAGIKTIPVLKRHHFNFLDSFSPYAHQKLSWSAEENVLLVAPTGQGKTESAIGWLKKQLSKRQGRAFYVLPFTASINAMTKRISGEKDGFNDESVVGLLHGKAKFFIDKHYEKKDGQNLKDLVDINKKIIKPFKVITPFQILKWAFGVKGFEKGFTELAGSYLIFDEIHIYDRELFERILFFIEWLVENLHVKVFIMTATIPTFMQNHIKKILNIKEVIKPDKDLILNIKRHKIKLLSSTIDEQIEFIQTNIDKGKNVLVVCNTVGKSQKIFNEIKCDNKALLHSGFNAKDRTDKEEHILSKETKPQLLVGTQAIEISLDIDYDLIITEPAPLDALLQRFGRVYRNCGRIISPEDEPNCFVTRVIEDVHCRIYEKDLIEKTLSELEKVENSVLNEDMVQEILDSVYAPFELDSDLRDMFRRHLDDLYPFVTYEDGEEEFFAQFDGIEILPVELFDKFKSHVHNKQFLDAEKLFVSISRKKYAANKALITHASTEGYKKVFPLIGLKYSEELGLLNEEVDGDYKNSSYIF